MVYKKVRLIEKVSFLSIDSKTNILLVYAGQKPATFFTRRLERYDCMTGELEISHDKRYLRDTARLLNRLGLPHVISEEDNLMRAYAAGSESVLERITKAWHEKDEREIGRCFGFPETAISAYLGEMPRFRGNLHRDGSPSSLYTQFIYSAQFWKEEMESASRRWNDTVRRLSPRLYEEASAEAVARKYIKKGRPVDEKDLPQYMISDKRLQKSVY